MSGSYVLMIRTAKLEHPNREKVELVQKRKLPQLRQLFPDLTEEFMGDAQIRGNL